MISIRYYWEGSDANTIIFNSSLRAAEEVRRLSRFAEVRLLAIDYA